MHGDTNAVYQYYGNDNECKRLFSDTGILSINDINNRLYVVKNNELYWYNRNELVDLKFPQIADDIYHIYGRHVNDILIRTRSNLMHYNGKDIININSFDNNWTYSAGGAIVFNEDIFFNCSDYKNKIYYVLHGKLNW